MPMVALAFLRVRRQGRLSCCRRSGGAWGDHPPENGIPVGAARDTDSWDFCGARQACGWRHEDRTAARQQTAIPKVLKPGHLISRHSPSKDRVSAWCPNCDPQVSRLESIKTSGVLVLIVLGWRHDGSSEG